MPIYSLDGIAPEFDDRASNWIAPDAVLIGRVRLGRNAGIWFGAVHARRQRADRHRR